jgi:hypothetical protein
MLDFLEKMRIDVLKILIKEEEEDRRGTLYLSGRGWGIIDMELWVWFYIPFTSENDKGIFEFDLKLTPVFEDEKDV